MSFKEDHRSRGLVGAAGVRERIGKEIADGFPTGNKLWYKDVSPDLRRGQDGALGSFGS